MKITNNFNLPLPIVFAIKNPSYSKGNADLSATELMGSPRISLLRKKHWDEIEMDAADGVFSLFGTAVHHILEKGLHDNHINEERLFTEVSGWTLSGAIDLQVYKPEGVLIQDYKTVGAWAVMNEKIEWEHQLNIYAWLVTRVKQQPVSAIEIVAIIRDWSRREAKYNKNYPQAQIVTLPIKLWTYEQQDQYVRERIKIHAEAFFDLETSGTLPLCTAEEMWEKPTMWAVKKPSNKKATAVFQIKEEAVEKQKSLGKDYEVEVRPGERVRCADYCQVNQFCSQWKAYNEAKLNDQEKV